MTHPALKTGQPQLDRAFRTALGDLYGNIQPFQSGLLEKPAPVILAGMDYDTPWTRDAAINVWNGAGLIFPQAAKNTLLAVLDREEEGVAIGGQYWDAVIWITGAWQHFLYTGDREFLQTAFEAALRSLHFWQQTEFDSQAGLFRGAACYGDGIAAYGDPYGDFENEYGSILRWVQLHPDQRAPEGGGIPMMALSTNCLYEHAFRLLPEMAGALGAPVDSAWIKQADQLKEQINLRFWDDQQGRYRYYLDPFGGSDAQESLGWSLAVLFGIAGERTDKLFQHACVTPEGVPCIWPSYERYRLDSHSFGRHSGTVWPHIQGFWADAAKQAGHLEAFELELLRLARHACQNGHFSEIYHPETGAPYGGVQELKGEMGLWPSCVRQTWSATAFLRIIFLDLFGMSFSPAGIRFSPAPLQGGEEMSLSGLLYRGKPLSVSVEGRGPAASLWINGRRQKEAFLSAEEPGESFEVKICLSLGGSS